MRQPQAKAIAPRGVPAGPLTSATRPRRQRGVGRHVATSRCCNHARKDKPATGSNAPLPCMRRTGCCPSSSPGPRSHTPAPIGGRLNPSSGVSPTAAAGDQHRPAAPRAVDAQRAAERGHAVGDADEPVARAVGAADAVVADLDAQHAVRRPRRAPRARRARVLDDVGQRLGDDEVGARLDLRREPLAPGRRRRPGGRAAPRTRRRRPAARRASGPRGGCRAPARAARHRRARRARAPRRRSASAAPGRRASARCASLSVTIVCTSRCWAPSWRSRTTRRRASSPAVEHARARRGELVAAVGVGDRGVEQLGELRQPLLGVVRRRRRGPPRSR